MCGREGWHAFPPNLPGGMCSDLTDFDHQASAWHLCLTASKCICRTLLRLDLFAGQGSKKHAVASPTRLGGKRALGLPSE